jgi:hypothetical protein
VRAGDPAWTRKLEEAFESALRAAGDDVRGVDFSISEAYRDPPADLAPEDGTTLGWTCRIIDGAVVEFLPVPEPEVDCRIELDYPVFAELAASVIAGDPAKQEAMEQRQASAIADGSMVVSGAIDKVPPCFADVHDTMARILGAPTGRP